jgi:hypothetical protein
MTYSENFTILSLKNTNKMLNLEKIQFSKFNLTYQIFKN